MVERHLIERMLDSIGTDRKTYSKLNDEKLLELFQRLRHRGGDVSNELHMNWTGDRPAIPVKGGPADGQGWHHPVGVVEIETGGHRYVRRSDCFEHVE